jgi:hypothetical protein
VSAIIFSFLNEEAEVQRGANFLPQSHTARK